MIYYFSATGNSKYVAERIAAATGDKTTSVINADRDICLADGESFGIVTPTYFWELPVPVRGFLSRITFKGTGSHYAFLVATYGTTPGCCGEETRLILKRRGIVLDAAFSVKMPDSWTPMFDLSNPLRVAKQNAAAEKYISDVISRVRAKGTGNHTQRRIPYVFRFVTDPIFNGMRTTNHFRAEDSCIGCGLCARKCPVNAIEIRNQKPVWVKKRCVLCLGCLHRCPTFSIQYGAGITKRHGQYMNPYTRV